MTDSNDSLIALAECCEKETGPDRDLMTQAFALCFPKYYMPGRSGYVGRWTEFSKFLDARAWLDAAMTLVPEGLWVDAQFGDSRAQVRLGRNREWNHDPRFSAYAYTAALALCAAALRARAAQ